METRVWIAPAVWDEMASEQTFFLFWQKKYIFFREELVFWQVVKETMLIWQSHGQSWDCWLSVRIDKYKKVRDEMFIVRVL